MSDLEAKDAQKSVEDSNFKSTPDLNPKSDQTESLPSTIGYIEEITTNIFKELNLSPEDTAKVDYYKEKLGKLHPDLGDNSLGDILAAVTSDIDMSESLGKENPANSNKKKPTNKKTIDKTKQPDKPKPTDTDKQDAFDALEDTLDAAVSEKKQHEARQAEEKKSRDAALKKIEAEKAAKEKLAKDKASKAKEDAKRKEEAEGKEPLTEAQETKAEHMAQLKKKMHSNRQELIQKRKKQDNKKTKSLPLTAIYYCDGLGCTTIMGHTALCCPVCKCFVYCSKACQVADWSKHKLMCGKDPTEEYQIRLKSYMEARDAANTMFDKMKDGNYVTVIHEPGDVPAAIFSSVAEKSNVLHWKEYIKNSLFTTTPLSTVGSLAYKLEAAMKAYPSHKIFMISVLLDRIRDGHTSECVIRLFIADEYGETMNAGPGGKIMKQVVKYSRK